MESISNFRETSKEIDLIFNHRERDEIKEWGWGALTRAPGPLWAEGGDVGIVGTAAVLRILAGFHLRLL